VRQTLKHFLRVATGIGLVLLGITGIILPIMPGWIFLIPGLLILADYFPPLRRMVNWLKRKYEVEKEKWEAGRR
jgi:uncharacterized membrane protein YbaN (DUF454 family)